MYYSSTTSYYPVLLRTTKVLLHYYSVLQTYYSSTTPYYKVLLQYYKVLLCTTKYYSSTTSTETTSERRPSSTTPYYKVVLQYYKVLLQHYSVLQSTTPVLQSTKYYSSTTPYYKRTTPVLYSVLQSTTPVLQSTTLYYKVLLQYYFDRNDVRTTSIQYYSVLQSTTPVLQSTTPYYKVLLQYYSVLQSTTPVLLRTTNVLQSTTPYYRVLLQYYSVLQSSTKASKTSISCEASSTFQGTSFQNEHFVRDFINFSRNKLPKRAFRARLPQLFKEQASKTSISCEASATFQATSFQNEHFVRGFRNLSRNKLPKRAFRARLPQLFKEQASKTSISCEASSTFQSRSFQSLAPATQNAKMTSHLESLQRQNEHFVRDFLQISHFQLENRRFPASFSYKAIFTELKKYDFCEASATFQDNHQILRLPRYLQ